MLHVTTMELGVLETNCYVVHDGRDAVVIDPGGDPEKVLTFLRDAAALALRTILNTHLHFDHIQGNAGLVAATGVPILASPRDAFLLDTELGGGRNDGLSPDSGLSVRAWRKGNTHGWVRLVRF